MWDSQGEVAKWITYNFITFMTFDDRAARVVSCLQCRSVRYTDFQTCQKWPIAWLLRELPDIPAEFLQKLQVLVAQRRLQSTEAELETAFCGDLKQLKKEGNFLAKLWSQGTEQTLAAQLAAAEATFFKKKEKGTLF